MNPQKSLRFAKNDPPVVVVSLAGDFTLSVLRELSSEDKPSLLSNEAEYSQEEDDQRHSGEQQTQCQAVDDEIRVGVLWPHEKTTPRDAYWRRKMNVIRGSKQQSCRGRLQLTSDQGGDEEEAHDFGAEELFELSQPQQSEPQKDQESSEDRVEHNDCNPRGKGYRRRWVLSFGHVGSVRTQVGFSNEIKLNKITNNPFTFKTEKRGPSPSPK